MTFTIHTVNGARTITCDSCHADLVSSFDSVIRKWKASHACETPWSPR